MLVIIENISLCGEAIINYLYKITLIISHISYTYNKIPTVRRDNGNRI